MLLGVLMMKAEVPVLVHLQTCDVFFVELKPEGMRRNVLFSMLLKLRPNPLIWQTEHPLNIKREQTHSSSTSSAINYLFCCQVSKEKQICLTPGVTDQVTVRMSMFLLLHLQPDSLISCYGALILKYNIGKTIFLWLNLDLTDDWLVCVLALQEKCICWWPVYVIIFLLCLMWPREGKMWYHMDILHIFIYSGLSLLWCYRTI